MLLRLHLRLRLHYAVFLEEKRRSHPRLRGHAGNPDAPLPPLVPGLERGEDLRGDRRGRGDRLGFHCGNQRPTTPGVADGRAGCVQVPDVEVDRGAMRVVPKGL